MAVLDFILYHTLIVANDVISTVGLTENNVNVGTGHSDRVSCSNL